MAELIKVAADSRPSSVAGALAGILRAGQRAAVQAIGATAVNQAIKATIIANSYLQEDGLELALAPQFADVDIAGNARTALRFIVYAKSRNERYFTTETGSKITPEPVDETSDR